MKSINNYIVEKLDYSVKTPDLNDIAYDRSGDKWVIDAFCYDISKVFKVTWNNKRGKS